MKKNRNGGRSSGRARAATQTSVSRRTNVPQQTSASLREKALNRYVFTCIGMIMYIMPCLSCLGIGMVSEGGLSPAFILAIVVELLSIPVGLLGIQTIKKPFLRRWSNLAAAVLMVLHALCATQLLIWYLIMAPTFILLALFIAWSGVVKSEN